jgi:hypothetical protein
MSSGSDPAQGSAASQKGWLQVDVDPHYWIPCPVQFPPGMDRESWATDMSQGWWERSGLMHKETVIEPLATMLRAIHERAYATVPCHQIWIYLRDPAVPPLPVFIGIWKQEGERRARLRELAGADDKASARKPQVAEFATDRLGPGLRVMRYRTGRKKGALFGVLGYAFRSEEFETDLQLSLSSPDLRWLMTATEDIDQFIHGMSVYYNPTPPQVASA